MHSGASVLVVDDEESIRFTFEIFLSDAGYEVSTASNFDGALSLLDSRWFDLVIVDVILGGKNGLDLVREIRTRRSACPVIVVTGNPTPETAEDVRRCGVSDLLCKPVCRDLLLEAAHRTLVAH